MKRQLEYESELEKSAHHYGRVELAQLLTAIYGDERPVRVEDLQDERHRSARADELQREKKQEELAKIHTEGIRAAKHAIAQVEKEKAARMDL